jgi:hypothetical protein
LVQIAVDLGKFQLHGHSRRLTYKSTIVQKLNVLGFSRQQVYELKKIIEKYIYILTEIKKCVGDNNFNGYTNTIVVKEIAKISAPSSRISEYFSYQLSFKEV